MTRTLDDDIADYLWSEADRVVVYDTLADIEEGITFVPVARTSQQRKPAPVLLVAAALVALVVGLVVVRDTRPQDEPTAAQPDITVQATVATVAPETTPSSTTIPPTTVPAVRVPLPAGAVLQGVVPSCTTLDSIEYDCTIAAYPDLVLTDMTGYTTVIVDDTSHVSGGCRAITPDALTWTCYVGQASVDQQIVGANYLGDWAPRGYVAG
jgi:hypothetical protein